MDLTTTVSLERVMFERQLDELKAEQRTIVDELNTEHARKMRGLELQIESGEIALRASVDERHLVEAALTAAQYRIRECEEYGKLGEEKLRRRDRRIKSLLEANLCAICKVNKVVHCIYSTEKNKIFIEGYDDYSMPNGYCVL